MTGKIVIDVADRLKPVYDELVEMLKQLTEYLRLKNEEMKGGKE